MSALHSESTVKPTSISAKMIILMVILLIGLFGTQTSAELNSLAKANNDFSVKIYKTLPPTENAFYSPASLFIAMGMLYKGAGGKTAQQMREALSYEIAQLSDESVHQQFKDLLELLEKPSDNYTLQIANALVSSSSYSISDQYKEALERNYKATTKEIDFGAEKQKALKEINDWVSGKTHGKIPTLLDDLDKDTVMVLLNAVYFKGSWKTKFEEGLTKDDVFYSNGKDAKPVRMMNIVSNFPYKAFPENKFKALKLPYKGDDISMIIILPFERDGVKALEKSISLQKVMDITASLNHTGRKVKVSIPKFKLEDSRKFVETLKQLGMKDAFINGAANFTGIDKSGRMIVSDVVHKAVIEVNEEGSEAAAATGVIGVIRSSRPFPVPEFRANHPFLFYIHDERTGMFLFTGRIHEL